jgi:hypothetical protein
MRKLQLLILAAAVAAGAIWWGFYRTHHTSSLGVASLLPKETLALVHLPDFNQSRADWHRTDLYQLWQEPTVQEFLAKPRGAVAPPGRVGQTVDEIASFEMKDAFFAVVSIESSAWNWDGGFRCAGDVEKAAKLVEEWRTRILAGQPDLKHQTIDYQGRQIHNDTAGIIQIWTVWAGPWFFFANNLENLKALLDRADGRVKDASTVLSSDETFLAASKHMPASYAAMVFGRVAPLVEKLTPTSEQAEPSDRLALVRQIRSFCAAMAFDGGRMHDTVFVGVPKMAEAGNLTRSSLPIATKDAFLYAASVLDFRKEMKPGWQTPGFGWLGGLDEITDALAANGITLEEWKNAFGTEISLIGSWAANSQWPSLVAALPVKDAAKANQIVTTITSAKGDDLKWRHREKDGASYYSSSSGPQLFSFSPTIGLSDRMLVVGLDGGSVETAIKHATGSSELAATRNFQNAERAVPTAQQAFAYVDPALIYARFDASLRPLLAMGAAFLPSLADTVDIGKLPPAEVVTRHLSPTVMSQSYRGDGYVAESIGSIPFYQTVVGAVTAGVIGTSFAHSQDQGGPRHSIPSPSPSPSSSPN